MRIEARKLAFIIISSICIVSLLIYLNSNHLSPLQQHTIGTLETIDHRLQSSITSDEKTREKLFIKKESLVSLVAVKDGNDEPHEDIIPDRENSALSSTASQSFLAVDSTNYKDGLIVEHICCKSLPGSISEIATLCLENADQFDQLKVKKMNVECSCIDYFMCRLVVVSAFSSNHFNEAQDMIASIQHNLPHTKLIIYDLGLSASQKGLVQNYCNVEYRSFNFSRYPSHTRNLRTYAFKPLIVNEISKEYEVVMWADASVRVMQPFAATLFPYFGIFPFLSGPLYSKPYPIVSLTHDGMLKYLNITQSREELKDFITLQACNWILWMNTLMREKLLKYWVNCALHQDCIAPKGSRRSPCKFEGGTNLGNFFNCHRYDQSALNFILIREFGLDIWDAVYHKEVETVLKIERAVTKQFTPAATAPC